MTRAKVTKFAAGGVLFTLLLLVGGCVSSGTPPVSDRSRTDNSTAREDARAAARQGLPRGRYRVVAGDTLYSIAWRYQRDFRDLAQLNDIAPPFEIYPGQVLRVRGTVPPRQKSRSSAAPSAPVKSSTQPQPQPPKPHPLAITQTKPQAGSAASSTLDQTTAQRSAARVAKPAVAPQSAAAQVARTGPVALRWPSNGKRIRAFGSKPSDSGKPSNNVDFALPPGGVIRAAGAGEVVFARASLAGYRQFVILKHNDTWLSSYGFNAPLQVREGQQVAAGAVLASLGSSAQGASDAPDERVLRFEVRKDGTAVNPASVIR